MSITKAQQAKAEKALQKTIRTEEGAVMTKKEWLQKLVTDGWLPSVDTKSSVKWNRTKYNRMNWMEQAVYEEQLDTLVPSYEARRGSNLFELSITEYKYMLELTGGETYNKNP